MRPCRRAQSKSCSMKSKMIAMCSWRRSPAAPTFWRRRTLRTSCRLRRSASSAKMSSPFRPRLALLWSRGRHLQRTGLDRASFRTGRSSKFIQMTSLHRQLLVQVDAAAIDAVDIRLSGGDGERPSRPISMSAADNFPRRHVRRVASTRVAPPTFWGLGGPPRSVGSALAATVRHGAHS